ncbi:MAG: hypothetical protein ACKO54_14060, partial [Alphaproteobacteria bacterium]
CKFRHLIEAKGIRKMALTAVNDHLKSKGIEIGTGTIMDAKLISARLPRPRRICHTAEDRAGIPCQQTKVRGTGHALRFSARLPIFTASGVY